ncbi:MAG: hypothetical protein P8Y17_02945, partial [Patescibacteria group bacterium]
RFSYPKRKFLGLFYIWIWFFKNILLLKDADIVHIHDVFIWYLPFCFIFPFKPVYITFHGWEGVYPIPFKNILYKKIAAKLARGNICVGSYISTRYHIDADFVVYGAVKNFPKKIKKEDRKIVYVGRLEKDNGLPLLLKVFSRLKNFRIDFCGDGSLAKECLKYGKVHGFVNAKPFLSKAKFCFAGGYLSILEAFSQKSLVVTAYENSFREEYLRETPFAKWMIIGNSENELLNKIEIYARDNEKAGFVITRAYNWVKKRTWKELAKVYLTLWQKRFNSKSKEVSIV